MSILNETHRIYKTLIKRMMRSNDHSSEIFVNIKSMTGFSFISSILVITNLVRLDYEC